MRLFVVGAVIGGEIVESGGHLLRLIELAGLDEVGLRLEALSEVGPGAHGLVELVELVGGLHLEGGAYYTGISDGFNDVAELVDLSGVFVFLAMIDEVGLLGLFMLVIFGFLLVFLLGLVRLCVGLVHACSETIDLAGELCLPLLVDLELEELLVLLGHP